MIYGVFSDVHSNLQALDAVLDFFSDLDVGGYICCGDLVGYGADPDACIARIRALKNLALICGNHDLAVLGRIDAGGFNSYARAAVLWTRDTISSETKALLESLTARLDRPEFTVAHGSPRRPPEEYLLSAAQFRDNIEHVRTWPLFIGHSHMPLCFRMPADSKASVETIFLEENQEVSLPRVGATFGYAALNPGSVGQPRDHDNRAACGIYDSDKATFRVMRLPYDIAATQAKIRAAGLPEYLALRLAYGQ